MNLNTNNVPKDLSQIRCVHFVGICGAGMSGIAEVMAKAGFIVSGSDLNFGPAAERLQKIGVVVYRGQKNEHVGDAELLVVSSAIDENNPEIQAALDKNIPIILRAQMLSLLMDERFGIAIAGTHGKTTTTSLTTTVLSQGGLDPTFLIGGLLAASNCNGYLGSSPYLVAEADESDASLLYLNPKIAVVTNIDADHTWFYDNNFDKIRQTFVDFLHRLPPDGLAILCIDDIEVANILNRIERPLLTYGFSDQAMVRAENFYQIATQSFFELYYQDEAPVSVILNMPGRHNVLNALAAYAIGRQLGVPVTDLLIGLKSFQGVGRRFQLRGEIDLGKGRVSLIDDYGHHPREINATIDAIRSAWPDKKLVMTFQPHRYSRTQALYEDFAAALSAVDKLVLMDIYSAGESPIEGVDGQSLYQSVRERGLKNTVFVPCGQDLVSALQSVVEPGDILLMQGAGDIGGLAKKISEDYALKTDLL